MRERAREREGIEKGKKKIATEWLQNLSRRPGIRRNKMEGYDISMKNKDDCKLTIFRASKRSWIFIDAYTVYSFQRKEKNVLLNTCIYF